METNNQLEPRNSSGKLALHEAVIKNDISETEKLLTQQFDINLTDNFGKTALHIAALKNVNESHIKVAKMLLIKGADPNARDNLGQTPLFHLIQKGNVKILQLFFSFKADVRAVPRNGENLLFQAVENDENLQVLQLLISLGLDVNHRSSCQLTPLQHACGIKYINMKIIKYLLKNGAKMYFPNLQEKWTALHYAVSTVIKNLDYEDRGLPKKN